MGIWRWGGGMFKRVDTLDQFVAIKILQASRESRWRDE